MRLPSISLPSLLTCVLSVYLVAHVAVCQSSSTSVGAFDPSIYSDNCKLCPSAGTCSSSSDVGLDSGSTPIIATMPKEFDCSYINEFNYALRLASSPDCAASMKFAFCDWMQIVSQQNQISHCVGTTVYKPCVADCQIISSCLTNSALWNCSDPFFADSTSNCISTSNQTAILSSVSSSTASGSTTQSSSAAGWSSSGIVFSVSSSSASPSSATAPSSTAGSKPSTTASSTAIVPPMLPSSTASTVSSTSAVFPSSTATAPATVSSSSAAPAAKSSTAATPSSTAVASSTSVPSSVSSSSTAQSPVTVSSSSGSGQSSPISSTQMAPSVTGTSQSSTGGSRASSSAAAAGSSSSHASSTASSSSTSSSASSYASSSSSSASSSSSSAGARSSSAAVSTSSGSASVASSSTASSVGSRSSSSTASQASSSAGGQQASSTAAAPVVSSTAIPIASSTALPVLSSTATTPVISSTAVPVASSTAASIASSSAATPLASSTATPSATGIHVISSTATPASSSTAHLSASSTAVHGASSSAAAAASTAPEAASSTASSVLSSTAAATTPSTRSSTAAHAIASSTAAKGTQSSTGSTTTTPTTSSSASSTGAHASSTGSASAAAIPIPGCKMCTTDFCSRLYSPTGVVTSTGTTMPVYVLPDDRRCNAVNKFTNLVSFTNSPQARTTLHSIVCDILKQLSEGNRASNCATVTQLICIRTCKYLQSQMYMTGALNCNTRLTVGPMGQCIETTLLSGQAITVDGDPNLDSSSGTFAGTATANLTTAGVDNTPATALTQDTPTSDGSSDSFISRLNSNKTYLILFILLFVIVAAGGVAGMLYLLHKRRIALGREKYWDANMMGNVAVPIPGSPAKSTTAATNRTMAMESPFRSSPPMIGNESPSYDVRAEKVMVPIATKEGSYPLASPTGSPVPPLASPSGMIPSQLQLSPSPLPPLPIASPSFHARASPPTYVIGTNDIGKGSGPVVRLTPIPMYDTSTTTWTPQPSPSPVPPLQYSSSPPNNHNVSDNSVLRFRQHGNEDRSSPVPWQPHFTNATPSIPNKRQQVHQFP